MLKQLCMLFLLGGICIVSNGLLAYNNKQKDIFVDGTTVYVDAVVKSLDFSKKCPLMTTLVIQPSWNHQLGSFLNVNEDLGLGKNVNLKNLLNHGDFDCQIPISYAYLPSVESYYARIDYNDFSYLPSAFPNLKSLDIVPREREKYAEVFKNVSQLEHLENLRLSYWYGERQFTDEEIQSLVQMQYLKNLHIHMGSSYDRIVFDQESLQLLKVLMPNTKITTDYEIYNDVHD